MDARRRLAPAAYTRSTTMDTKNESTGFEIEVLAEAPAEVVVPIPGGCNSSNGSNSSCSNDNTIEDQL
jgi:hypothetical protein